VPFIVRWPGVVKPGSVCDRLVHQSDLMRTFAQIVGVDLPDTAGEDSVSILSLLRGEDKTVRETAISQSINGLLAIRRGEWKLIFGKGSGGWTKGGQEQPGQLYNLAEDLGETKNLYASKSKLVAELMDLMATQVSQGRSTPGPKQANDVKVTWNRIKEK